MPESPMNRRGNYLYNFWRCRQPPRVVAAHHVLDSYRN